MRQRLILLGIVIGTLIGLFLYCVALIDWVQDYKTGVFAADHIEAIRDTLGILIYSGAGFIFLKSRLVHH
ncbi:hypothetical protein GO730_31320 [Spirosoma sp. HMF3257]|uniref:DUF4386 family protein n=1 Tax=Spirosoma telluris TaxID=2183553 RepID=A0A327NX91_9BACT|nr:hypothetical protein [Spirosoma telluris]RAI77518.1 hypothetical protein HMF3257_31220 [Spirosoma telluris]